tara:strand:- start:4393 stop:4851 length:459 start_codon:yes stop_codon:yes gene_type:complete
LHKKTEWVTRTLKKKGKCVACWREFAPGDTVVTPIRDDVLHTNATYCPRGLEHIDNITDYRNYLREHKKITDVDEVEMLATKWLIHRSKKGYESVVDIKQITKENKEVYKSAVDYKITQKQKELNKFLEKVKLERQKLIDEIVDLENKKESI